MIATAEKTQKQETQNYDPLNIYLKQISQFQLLTFEDEQRICSGIKYLEHEIKELEVAVDFQDLTSDYINKKKSELKSLKDLMINSNLRLVVSIAKKNRHKGLSLLDLINEGNIGLIEGLNRFDYSKGYRFSTYAPWWIKQEIIKSIAEKVRTIRLPVYMLNKLKNFNDVQIYLTQQYGREPNILELAEYLNVTEVKIKEMMINSKEISSLDSVLENDNKSDLLDFLIDEHSSHFVDDFFHVELQETIDSELDSLSAREKQIIQLRYGLCGQAPQTLDTAGQMLGITRERVRQIQQKTIMKLKKSEKINDYYKAG
ncbi:MAG: RNA polymerase sigma factor RpoD/SigA [Spirochaetaceae bacterium]|jgi:RNA polymerase primary sigma factor|nr:RNA polymerase sigma factor RpoD/SigA [Spirochaetaceae bacterium]